MLDSSKTTIQVGLIGSGIQLSRSPALHEAEASANGLALSYELIDLDRRGVGLSALPSLLREVEARGFAGVNITHPAKQAVIQELDALSPEAEALGAVNTVVLEEGRRTGHNTDCSGFAEGFRRNLPGADLAHAVQLGAGGAGAAVARAMLQLGTRRLTLFDRDEERAEQMAEKLARQFPRALVEPGRDLPGSMREATGLVHATPTGMAAHPGLPLDPALIEARHFVAEIVYFPLETELLKVARAKGCRTVDGGGMAVFQAAGAFRHFTGLEPDPSRMLAHFATMGA
ncbi:MULTISPECIES: shikimate dehydrogenase [unclassified Aureimonas]|uniref:shikimate dehydrogenase n=1 Tax=unclassified Aureimonas TaxID=2615206 RepID=UPI0006F41AC3|nr:MULTISPECIES: shikimate dehydrogenase [unclassified Aureimonas]KQT61233.1 shikimate dehydrogenase [Aureimonas sp. Leaf460]KQT68682.1 shikimate dehydrogenase [Aureimonas sp. Leaf427]